MSLDLSFLNPAPAASPSRLLRHLSDVFSGRADPWGRGWTTGGGGRNSESAPSRDGRYPWESDACVHCQVFAQRCY